MNENEFETELIQYICSGVISKPQNLEESNNYVVKEENADYLVKKKLWEYKPEIKTTEQLWNNFEEILREILNA